MSLHLRLTLCTLGLAALPAWSQASGTPPPPVQAPQDAKTEAKAPAKPVAAKPRPLAIQDLGQWKTLSGVALSRQGTWAAWRTGAIEADGEVVVKEVSGKGRMAFPAGFGGGAPVFDPQGQWVAFRTFPGRKETEAAQAQHRSLPPGLSLVRLGTDAPVKYDKLQSFAFAGDRGGWLAIHLQGEGGRSGDLLLRDLASGRTLNLGSVSEYAFDKTGTWLAYLSDTPDKTANGLVLRDMRTGLQKVVDGDPVAYRGLTWSRNGESLAVLKGVEEKGETLWALLTLRDLEKGVADLLDGTTLQGLPKGMALTPDMGLKWDEAQSRLTVGIKERRSAEKELPDPPQDEMPNLLLWHHKDVRLQSMQRMQEFQDRSTVRSAVVQLATRRVVPLSDAQVRRVEVPVRGNWALGHDVTPYEFQSSLDGTKRTDIHGIDLQTGSRRLLVKGCQVSYDLSPDSRTFFHFTDGHFHAVDMATGKDRNLTRDLPVSFANTEDDHPGQRPPVMPLGWTSDSRALVLCDGWDVWRVPVDGSAAVNLTRTGRKEGLRFQNRLLLDPEERSVDLSRSQYFTLFADRTKQAGFARLDPDGRVERLRLEDAGFKFMEKAAQADVFAYCRTTATSPVEFHVTDGRFTPAPPLTDMGTQATAFTLSPGVRRVEYKGVDGKPLQGALFLPAGYQKGKTYPTIVYVYEKLSQDMHTFDSPGLSPGGFNQAFYTSQGYAVFTPDITYRLNDPGMSAVACILPALRAAETTGVVDPKRVALFGHSWGGYETAFTITQTSAFKAAVAGAALTDLVSMYGLVYKNTGGGNQPLFESSQVRFTGPVTDLWQAYVRNSPVYHARKVETPLLLLQNDADGAVDYTQGLGFFNTLRRLGKDVVMLEYPGENHGLRRLANRKDYMQRMKAFFDHHLKGAPAPEWLTSGIPFVNMKTHLKASLAEAKSKKEGADAPQAEGAEKGEAPTAAKASEE